MSALSELAGPMSQLANLRSEMRALRGAIEVQHAQRSMLETVAASLRSDMGGLNQSIDMRRAQLVGIRNRQSAVDRLAEQVSAEARATTEELRFLRQRQPLTRDDATTSSNTATITVLPTQQRENGLPQMDSTHEPAVASVHGEYEAISRAAHWQSARERMRRRGLQADQAARAFNARNQQNGGHMFNRLVALSSEQGPPPLMIPPLGEPIVQEATLSRSLEDVCPICLAGMKCGETAVTLECGHVFHAGCAQRWLKKASVCPTCRARVRRQARPIMSVAVAEQQSQQQGRGHHAGGRQQLELSSVELAGTRWGRSRPSSTRRNLENGTSTSASAASASAT